MIKAPLPSGKIGTVVLIYFAGNDDKLREIGLKIGRQVLPCVADLTEVWFFGVEEKQFDLFHEFILMLDFEGSSTLVLDSAFGLSLFVILFLNGSSGLASHLLHLVSVDH